MTTRSCFRPAILGAAAALVTGCGLLDTQTPDIIQPGNVESPEGAQAKRAGVLADWAFVRDGDGTEFVDGEILLTGLLADEFVLAWRDRMVNIHPSLLPAFPGLHPQRQALAAGVRFSGCTVHFVRPQVDTGPIIAQAVVPVHPDDDEERLSVRILEAEHRLYPLAVRLIGEGRVHVRDELAAIDGWRVPASILVSPAEPLVSPAA